MTETEKIIKEKYEKYQLKDKINFDSFLKKVNSKKEIMGELVTYEVACDIVTSEIKPEALKTKTTEEQEITYLKLKEVSGTKRLNVNIKAKILDIGDTRNFIKKDGTGGKLKNIILGDETGMARLTVWDDISDKFGDEFSIDDSIALFDIYTKYNDYSKSYEISMSRNSTLEKSETDVTYTPKYIKFSDIYNMRSGYNLNIKCTVSGISEVTEFERNDGATGSVVNLELLDTDKTVMKLTLWDDDTSYLDSLDFGDSIVILGAYLRIREYDDKTEKFLQLGKNGKIVHIKQATL